MAASSDEGRVVLSFDVEEHWRIEAAAHLYVSDDRKAHYAGRVAEPTHWLLDQLGKRGIRATFFIVGALAREQPELVRVIHAGGHEVASHSWQHRRAHQFTPALFRQDLRKSKDVLEQITGVPVVGYRAPTFSIVRETAWALDVLAEEGLRYDSSIYPVHHDRYGVPDAPRWPFRARGGQHVLLELPPARLDWLGLRIPVGGGGYFRLFPPLVLRHALRQIAARGRPPVAMLYFHPWEFDPGQDRLPLARLSRFRTYVGVRGTRHRFAQLLGEHRFCRAVDVADELAAPDLPVFDLGCPKSMAPVAAAR
jgi:polysaccharide deacetylase family protein (PEP-CTERM system associated)